MYRAVLFLLLLLPVVGFSQKRNKAKPMPEPKAVYVFFLKDKQGGTFSLQHPEAYLSGYALERRARYKIALDSTDLPVVPKYLKQIVAMGAKLHHSSKWLNAVGAECTESVAQKIMALGIVKYYYRLKNKPLKATMSVRSYLQKEPIAWDDIQPTEMLSDVQNNLLRIGKLHKLGFDGNTMRIAILDAGFYKVNVFEQLSDIYKDYRFLDSWDFVDNDSTVYNEGYHGLNVLSTMAAKQDGVFEGTAPEASFAFYRTEDGGSENKIEEFNWVAAAERADSIGASLINSSLGYNNFDDTTASYTWHNLDGQTALSTLGANWAAKKGMLVVCSAGNSGDEDWKYITSPADSPWALTVGGVSGSGSRVYFSSKGVPEMRTIKPDVMGLGIQVSVLSNTGVFEKSAGTSFSSPLVCGAVACLWQAFPEFNAQEIIRAVQMSASKYYQPDFDYGYGIAHMDEAYDLLKWKRQCVKEFSLREHSVKLAQDWVLYLEFPDVKERAQAASLRIFSALGKEITNKVSVAYNPDFGHLEVYIHQLPLGFYTYEYTVADKTTRGKLVNYERR